MASVRIWQWFAPILFLLAGQASAPDQASVPACRDLKWSGPDHAFKTLSWSIPDQNIDRAKLDRWCETVGPALFRAPEGVPSSRNGRILVVGWNVHVGNGDIKALVDELMVDERKAGRGDPHFVFLLQEAFRRGTDVPAVTDSRGSIPHRIPSSADDIDVLARTLDWWLFYVPSMRNGGHSNVAAEDRGNAILSSLPLDDIEAIELPFSVQRRVAATAIVNDRERALRFRVAAVHLDTRAPLARGFIFGASVVRNRQARQVAEIIRHASGDGLPVIVGGDLNSYWGPLESSIDTLARVVPRIDCGKGATHKTGFTLDHMFARFSESIIPLSCRRAGERFGSDHYPLVLSLQSSAE